MPDDTAPDGLLQARDLRGLLLGEAPFAFKTGELETEARFDLPVEIRNDIARIEVETEWPLPVQIDGEYLCETPIRLALDPLSLNVLIAPEPNVLLTRG